MSLKVAPGLEIFLFTIGFFTLMRAGVGVANIMFVVVMERTREIGVKLAVGARKVHIITQFIVKSLLVSFIGGGLGIAIAAVAGFAVLTLHIANGAGAFLV